MTYPHEFRIACLFSIFIKYYECNFLILITQCSDKKLRMSRGVRLILDGNPKGCEVAKHIATKVEINPRMLSTLKKGKSIWSMKQGGYFETSVVVPLKILVYLVKRKIGQCYSKSGRFSGRPYVSTFFAISFSLVIETWTKIWWMIWERFFWKCIDSWDNNILVYMRVYFEMFYLNIVNIVLSLVGWSQRKTLRVNKVTMFKRFRRNLLKSNIKFEGTWCHGVGRVTWKIINWYHWIYNKTVRKMK